MYASSETQHSISTLISQTTSMFMGLCMCQLPVVDRPVDKNKNKQDTKVLFQNDKFVNTETDASRMFSFDDPMIIKQSIVALKDDDDTASTTSMNPLSFDESDSEMAYYNQAISIQEIQLDLENGNYRDVFRKRIADTAGHDEDGEKIQDDRFRYFSSTRFVCPE